MHTGTNGPRVAQPEKSLSTTWERLFSFSPISSKKIGEKIYRLL
jgi:hypothetical protein